MPVSSFFGMQTSLRGLLAQQRMLDTTGHNIANASTQGYSRQQATLAAASSLQIQVQGTGAQNASGAAQLGAGVDVTGFRRVRDQFLDSQYRAQNTSAQRVAGAHRLARQCRALPAGAGRERHQPAAEQVLGLLERRLQGPERPLGQAGARPAVAEPDRLDPRRPLAARRFPADRAGQVHRHRRPRRPGLQDRRRARGPEQDDLGLPDDRRPAERPDGPPRHAARPALRLRPDLGRPALQRFDERLLRRRLHRHRVPDRHRQGQQLERPARPPAGARAARWAACSPPAAASGQIAGYISQLDSFSQNLADTVNGAYGGNFFSTGSPAGSTIDVAVADQGRPGQRALRLGRRGLQRHRALDLAAARQRVDRRHLQGLRREGRR